MTAFFVTTFFCHKISCHKLTLLASDEYIYFVLNLSQIYFPVVVGISKDESDFFRVSRMVIFGRIMSIRLGFFNIALINLKFFTSMPYSLTPITSTADCDVLIDMINSDKSALEYKISGLERQKINYSTTSFSVSNELLSLENKLVAVETNLQSLGEGEEREDAIIEQAKLTLQILQLNKRKKDYGHIALINKELDLERAVNQMTAINACLGEVQSRKASLTA